MARPKTIGYIALFAGFLGALYLGAMNSGNAHSVGLAIFILIMFTIPGGFAVLPLEQPILDALKKYTDLDHFSLLTAQFIIMWTLFMVIFILQWLVLAPRIRKWLHAPSNTTPHAVAQDASARFNTSNMRADEPER